MSLMVKLRRGEGPFWGTLKRFVLGCLHFHIPVVGILRPIFGLLYALHVGLGTFFRMLLRFFWSEPLFRSQCERVGGGFKMYVLPYISGTGRIVVGDHVVFGGKVDFTFGNRGNGRPEVVIGNHTFLGHECCFTTSDSIHIGNHCLIASGVQISDYDGHPIDAQRRRAGDPTPSENIRPVVIGDDVWIGNDAKILKGVTVGDRAIVGAGAVVTRNVPPDVVVAGNPACVVKHLTPLAVRLDAPTPVPASAGEPA